MPYSPARKARIYVGIPKCGEKKKIRKRLCLPLAPSVAPICAPASPDREGAGRDRRSCVPCAVHHTLCSTQLTQLTVWSSSAHCAQTCVLLYSSGKVSVVCRGVTLAPTAHPTANVVSQGKAPSLPKSVQIWLIGRDISQNSKNSSLNPWPFFIWMLLGKISILWECIYFAEHQSKVKALKLGFASSSVDMSWQ